MATPRLPARDHPAGARRKPAGTLYVVATPIGNLADLSARAHETLAAADHILAEDTRRARTLLSHIGVATRPMSLHAHNEAARISLARRWLATGDHVALVSDAGTPLLSDPGERLARAAIEDGHDIVPIPGPSAILAGLVASGLPPVPFTFLGFPPRRGARRARALERIVGATETTVLFESARRLAGLLGELAAFPKANGGRRRIAVCREMTKVHEEVFRGTLAEGARHFVEHPPLGEVTVVVEGCPGVGGEAAAAAAEALAGDALEAGLSPTAAAREVAARSGVSRSAAYEAVMRVKGGRDD
ncbi:MAG: 16S rRNA (cytidine(1402)-2'-O)-methyltransferase [Gemmatimonadota bacterium]|nr:16S rRNA (cytidine(1402)-2'-O)-methyltransferase [Gemmatimonadota bacterium]MDE2873757.1 16S rRNA (cytidine(1402)-2'-O)-methyltransferase [Gemmatimonadota bacterium]